MSKLEKREIEELIDILGDHYPAAKETIQAFLALRNWAKQIEYPINSFADLTKQEQKKPIMIDNKPTSLVDITGAVPSYYFPLASYENLIENAHELYSSKTRQPSLLPIDRGVGSQFAPADKSFPPVSGPKFVSTQRGPVIQHK